MSLEDQSVDPSVAMAKAYCKEKKDEEKKSASEDDGPLAFLGLHRKSVDAESGDDVAAADKHRDDDDVDDQVGFAA